MQIAAPIMVAHLRKINAQNLPHEAVITLPVWGQNANGRRAIISRTVIASSACRLSLPTKQDQERIAAAQLTAPVTYVVAFPAGSPVLPGHELTVTGDTTHGDGTVTRWSKTLAVVGVQSPDTAGEFLRKAYAGVAP